jgi:hypothetical protein
MAFVALIDACVLVNAADRRNAHDASAALAVVDPHLAHQNRSSFAQR